MKFLKRRFAAAPEGTAALFFIQIFSTLGFAVLYSTLVLYATKHLQLPVKVATTLMGVFGAFNYGLHLFGGYLGGRFLSNRNLFIGGMALQVIGCGCIAVGTLAMFYVGLARFLTGSGLNVTCINMMLTQRFTPADPRREGAFFWNYAGMTVGFFVGFSAAGYFQATQSYSSLFIFATLGNFGAIVLALFNWKTLTDRNTPLLDATRKQYRLRQLAGLAILIGLVPVVWFMLQRPGSTETILKAICGAVALTLIYLTVRHHDRREKRNMTAYLILTIGSLMFWSLYQSYVLQSIGELLIMPIGYAMIGKLAPKQYQGVMMGSWMLVTGLASLFAGDFSGMIPEPTGTTAIATNADYANLFAELGAGSLAVGITLVVLIPFLRKLITDKAETPPPEMLATVVPVAPVI